MKPAILLTGASGQVGRELLGVLPRVGEVAAPDRRRLDLSNAAEIQQTIRQFRPRLIVNTAAYTAVDQAESDEGMAHAINAEAPRVMAEEAKKVGAALLHFSTDYVFDGLKDSPYEESDRPNPVSAYGRTKLAGERAIQESGVPHLIFRTGWVYSTRGRNFLLTILRLASQREELRVVRDQIGAPTWAREIACATTSVLDRLFASGPSTLSFPDLSGVYHMSARGSTSWHCFAEAILEEASQAPPDLPWIVAATQGAPLAARRVLPITTDDYPTPARRPRYSALSNARITQTFGVQLADWRNALHEVFRGE